MKGQHGPSSGHYNQFACITMGGAVQGAPRNNVPMLQVKCKEKKFLKYNVGCDRTISSLFGLLEIAGSFRRDRGVCFLMTCP